MADSHVDYRAAGVVFFTKESGQVRHVLLSLEERKVSPKQLGLAPDAAGGRAARDVVVFPQGRRERKDEGDPVETAMREYHEETGNFGFMTQHLLRFYEDAGDAGVAEDEGKAAASGAKAPAVGAGGGPGEAGCAQSFAMYFDHARMVVIFCEVPATAYERSLRPLSKADFAAEAKKTEEAEPEEGPPPAKRPRRKSGHSYHVGRENHLTPVWVSAEALRAAVVAPERSASIEVTVCPRQSVDGTGRLGTSEPGAAGGEHRVVPFFPLNLSMFRQREARLWLGLPVATGKSGDGAAAGAP